MITTGTLDEDSLSRLVIGDFPGWGGKSLGELRDTLLSFTSPFPCTFAVSGLKRGMLRFGFVEDLWDERTWAPLVTILTAYLERYRDIGRETSLVVFFRPDERTRQLSDYRERFWAVLRYLHERDQRPWPADIPREPDDPWWEFSFHGAPVFVVCNTPAHVRRNSRHHGGFLITFQPRWVFEELAEGTPKGDASRRVIRERLRRFDRMEPSPLLGAYGDPRNREWRQYFLPDTDGTEPASCPFHARDRD